MLDYFGVQLSYSARLGRLAIASGLVSNAIVIERERIVADFKGVIESRLSRVEWQIKAARVGYGVDKASSLAS